MDIEELLPRIVEVTKNLNTGKFSFEVREGTLTETEKKLFTEDSDPVILKNYSGHGINYYMHKTKIAKIVEKIPLTKMAYITHTRTEAERRR